MGYKKIIIEESDGENVEHDHSIDQGEYIPSRGEAFSMGMVSGWSSANKIFPFILLIVFIVFMFVC